MKSRHYPLIELRRRGEYKGLKQIVLSESQSYGQAQESAKELIEKFSMKIIEKVDGPEGWLWDVDYDGASLIIGYDDFPCESTVIACSQKDEAAVSRLFTLLTQKNQI